MTALRTTDTPTDLRVWEDEEIKSEVQEMKQSLLDEGWDDVIYYRYEEVDTSVRSLLFKLLNHKNVIDVSQNFPVNGEILSTGIPITFGGLKKVKNPAVARIASYQLYDPGNEELQEVANGLIHIMLVESFEKADRAAEEFIREYNGSLIPHIVQGFFYSLTPVMFKERDDGTEENDKE